MSSSSNLYSKYFNKLDVNRLQANQIKSLKSFLFSSIFSNSSIDIIDSFTLHLTLSNSDFLSCIQFTDRPLRQYHKINFSSFISFFDKGSSFSNIPPNGVLSFNNFQQSFEFSLLNFDNDTAVFKLTTLKELKNKNKRETTDKLQNGNTGSLSIFIDSVVNTNISASIPQASIDLAEQPVQLLDQLDSYPKINSASDDAAGL
jgi:hypothetical protein